MNAIALVLATSFVWNGVLFSTAEAFGAGEGSQGAARTSESKTDASSQPLVDTDLFDLLDIDLEALDSQPGSDSESFDEPKDQRQSPLRIVRLSDAFRLRIDRTRAFIHRRRSKKRSLDSRWLYRSMVRLLDVRSTRFDRAHVIPWTTLQLMERFEIVPGDFSEECSEVVLQLLPIGISLAT